MGGPSHTGTSATEAEDELADVIAVLLSRALVREVKMIEVSGLPVAQTVGAEAAPGAARKSRRHSRHKIQPPSDCCGSLQYLQGGGRGGASGAGGVAAGRRCGCPAGIHILKQHCRALDMSVTQSAVMGRKRRRRRQGQHGRAAARLPGRRRRSLWVSPSSWTGALPVSTRIHNVVRLQPLVSKCSCLKRR